MQTNQPKWKLVANLGDANPFEYGGYFVWEDETGVYAPEGEVIYVPDEDTPEVKSTIYRFSLDKCKMVDGYLVPTSYTPTWTHPVASYDEWFHKDLSEVEKSMDTPNLESMFCSDDLIERAVAYQAIGEYYGMENLDSYPLTLTQEEVKIRYKDLLD